MAKHIVKCFICGKSFDTNEIQAVRHGTTRYSHQTCEPTGEPIPMEPKKIKKKNEDPDLTLLKDYINQLYGTSANWSLITKQIKDFKENKKYSYTGIYKSLKYFYEVKGNKIDKSNGGIGIVPFCWQDAYNYYYTLFIVQQSTQNKILTTKEKEIIISPPKSQGLKKRFFNLEEVGNEEQ